MNRIKQYNIYPRKIVVNNKNKVNPNRKTNKIDPFLDADDDPDNLVPTGANNDEDAGGNCKIITKSESVQTGLDYYNVTLSVTMSKVYIK